MKPKKLNKKLSIVKNTVADLNHTELQSAKGGVTETLNPSGFHYCSLNGCQTFCLSNCETYEYPLCQPCTDNPTTIIE